VMGVFHTPWAFALLALVPLAVILHLRPKRRASIRFSSVESLKKLKPSLLYHMRHVPLVVRVAALVLLVVALARPRHGTERVVERSQGVALELVVDRSGSMRAEMKYRGEKMNRLEVVKRVSREFVIGNDEGLKGRSSDLIGMVAFARYPDTVCPLTHTHEALIQFIDTTELVQLRSENSTAIGDAIALAAARLHTAESDLKKKRLIGEDAFTIKSKAIVLLTDGRNRTGRRMPIEAARQARGWGIKIYCIGIGGERITNWADRFFGRLMDEDLDEETLKAVAAATGGFYQRATDAESLRKIYEKIDALEKTQLASERYVNYKEEFARWAVPALLLLLLEVGLSNTLFRRIP
jgi:Ca-activated chloride channel family protein